MLEIKLEKISCKTSIDPPKCSHLLQQTNMSHATLRNGKLEKNCTIISLFFYRNTDHYTQCAL